MTVPSSGATRTPSRVDPVLAGLGCFAAADLAWLAVPALLPSAGAVMVVVIVGLETGSAILGYRVAALLGRGSPARRFWLAWSAASVFYGAGVVVRYVGTPWASLSIGLGAAITIGALLTYPVGVGSRRERLCFWLDLATVMAGAAGFGGYAIFSADQRLTEALAEVVLGPVVLLVVVFAVAKLMLSGSAPFTRWTGLLGLAAAGLGGVIQAARLPMTAAGEERRYLALAVLVHILVVAAARFQLRQFRVDPDILARRVRRPYSPLPYLAIAATYALLVVALGQDGLHQRSWAVLVAAVVSTALVIARQLTAFAENARLLGELNAKVDDLDQARTLLQAAVDERDALTDQLRELAFRDSLTGLANRALFLDRLELAISRARRDGRDVAVLILDLDDFKPVNDQLGHAAGDAVLVEVAARLRGCLSAADTAARLGGDEFAVLVEGAGASGAGASGGALDAGEIAERIVAAVRRPYHVAGATVRVGGSVGVAHSPCGQLGPEPLLRAADAAMYAVKHRGKGGVGNAGTGTARPGNARTGIAVIGPATA